MYCFFFFRGGGCVVLYSFAHACLYIYTVYLDNLVSLYGVIVLVLLSCIYYCLLIIFQDIRRYYTSLLDMCAADHDYIIMALIIISFL